MNRYDEFARHYIDLEFSGNTLSYYVHDELIDMEKELDEYITGENTIPTKNVYKYVMNEINDEIEKRKAIIKKRIAADTDKTVSKENKWISGMVSAEVASEVILNKISMIPFNGEMTIDQFIDGLFSDIYNSYEIPVRTSYILKGTITSFISQLNRRNNNINVRAESSSQCIIPSVAKNTDRYVMQRDSSIKIWTWIAMLDTSTCIACGDLSGTTYTDLSSAPPCPLHNKCRCYFYPGVVEQPSYYEWFEKQDEKDKYEILGKTRYNLYKSGSKVKNFVNNGKKLTIDEIFSK